MDGPANFSTHSYSSIRKRKSRWDYQPESHYKMVDLQTGKVYSGHRELDLQTSLIRNRSQENWVTNSNHNDVLVLGSSTDGADDDAPPGFGADDDVPPGFGADVDVPPGFGADDDVPPGFGADDDVPPGFEPQQERHPAQAPLDLGGAPGFCQERHLPNFSTSSGIPVPLVQHFGTPEIEGTQCGQKWKVAPGVPFTPCPSTSSTHMSRHDGAPAVKHNSSGYGGRGAERGGRVHRNSRNGGRTRLPYDHQERRFPSNHHRLERCEPPRHQENDGSGFRGRE
jgi:histone-lysine N-methyltransferase SETD2